MTKNKLGFTLVELMVAVAILALLSLMVVNVMTQSEVQDKADLLKIKIFAGTIKNKLARNLVGDWSFFEGTGSSISDGSDYKNNFSSLNGADWVTGDDCVEDNCLSFNGTNTDYLEKSAPEGMPLGQSARTMEAWIYPTNVNPGGVIVSLSDSSGTNDAFIFMVYYSSFYATTFLFTDVNNSSNHLSITGTEIPLVNQWNHVALLFDGNSGYQYYLNGVLKKSGSFTTTINTYNNGSDLTNLRLSIGRTADPGYESISYWPGKIDEVRIYNSAVVLSEIKNRYLAGLEKLLSKKEITQEDYNQRIGELEKSVASK